MAEKVFIDKAGVEKLLGHIDGYGKAAEELDSYLEIYVCSESDRDAVASVPQIARQWDDLQRWRRAEARALANLFPKIATRVATAISQHLDTDIEVAATFPNDLMSDQNPISNELQDDHKSRSERPADRRWVGEDPTPPVDPDADYSAAAGGVHRDG